MSWGKFQCLIFVPKWNIFFKRYPPCKIWKKTIDNGCFFFFFTTLDLIWLKFCPKTTPTLDFSADFQWNMLKDSININNCNWNQVVSEKKCAKCKTSRNYHFWGNFHNNGVPMGHAQNKNNFFSEITKPDQKLSETFYLTKISCVLAELLMSFYLVWCFSAKKCHFEP